MNNRRKTNKCCVGCIGAVVSLVVGVITVDAYDRWRARNRQLEWVTILAPVVKQINAGEFKKDSEGNFILPLAISKLTIDGRVHHVTADKYDIGLLFPDFVKNDRLSGVVYCDRPQQTEQDGQRWGAIHSKRGSH